MADDLIGLSERERLARLARVESTFMSNVYKWMFIGLLLTAIVAYCVSLSPALISLIFESKVMFYGLLITEVLLVMYLSAQINQMSASVAIGLFNLYSILNGVTLSSIFLIYTEESLTSTFLISAGTFGLMSFYGYTTKKDLTSIGHICLMALIGLIIASVVNLFLHSSQLYWITSYAGVIIFVGLTAYDTQKIKALMYNSDSNSEVGKKQAVIGALTLYLDFINLFLYLLKILGKRRR
ncbi:MAG: hypothetical protein A2007_06295 [Verrucomicrobia bacterium GWC2_42_7]|nr:MAG: hypothetical protein A2007_06295 [Verrucomicrobia bacterium GWC2_42_7]